MDSPLGSHPRDAARAGRLELTFIGTATTLLRCGGFTILTDPNFLHAGERAYLGLGLSSRQVTDPAVEIDDLPLLDAVVLSHDHDDHFDRLGAARLDKDIPIVTESGSARKFRRQGFRNPVGLGTWHSHTLRRDSDELGVTALRGKHAPRPLQALLSDVMGSMLEFRVGGSVALRLYITGDTLLIDGLAEIPRRYPDVDACLIHLGGTRVAVLLTMEGAQGVEALRIVGPAWAVPIHDDDYTVFKSPLEDFRRAAQQPDLETQIVYVARGQTVTLDPARARSPGQQG